MFDSFSIFDVFKFSLKTSPYIPDTQYTWIVYNDNNTIVYNDNKTIVYEE